MTNLMIAVADYWEAVEKIIGQRDRGIITDSDTIQKLILSGCDLTNKVSRAASENEVAAQ